MPRKIASTPKNTGNTDVAWYTGENSSLHKIPCNSESGVAMMRAFTSAGQWLQCEKVSWLTELTGHLWPSRERRTHSCGKSSWIHVLSFTGSRERIHLHDGIYCFLRSIRKAKYIGLILNSTPDQIDHGHISEIVRYVEVDIERKTVRVIEFFLDFSQVSQNNTESLVEDILKQMKKDKIELKVCRSQFYDNVVLMAGHRCGVQ